MAHCPNINSEEVRNKFNSIVTMFDGTPLSIEEFKSVELRDEREGNNLTAMNVAYKVWNDTMGENIPVNKQDIVNLLVKNIHIKDNRNGKKDLNIKHKYFPNSNTTNTKEVLEKISKSISPLNRLASKLLDYIDVNNVKIELIDADYLEGNLTVKNIVAAAFYNPNKNIIQIAKNAFFSKGKSEITLLHEIIHSYTYHYLRRNDEASIKFKELYESIKKQLKDKKLYPLENVDEFMTGIFTDAQFIDILTQLPATNNNYRNKWEEIYNFILSLFNIKKGNTLYDQAFALATDVFENIKELNGFEKEMSEISDDAFLASNNSQSQEIKYNEKGEVLAPNGKVSKLFKDIENLINNNPRVVLPIGTSGSGKSTWIKSINSNNEYEVIEPDAMRVEFTGNMNDKSKDDEIYKEAAKRAIKALKRGKSVIFDTTNLKKERRRPFIEAIKKEMPYADIQYKLMPLNPELAKKRIKAQLERGENRANVSDETIDRHAKSYKQMLIDIKEEPISEYNNKKQQALDLYKQTRTQEFKDWFGDSKVVDENGEPLIVYHGSPYEYNEFKKETQGTVTDEGFAGKGFYFTPDYKLADGYTADENNNEGRVKAYFLHAEKINNYDRKKGNDQNIGYDGVNYDNGREYVVFEPNQIKSVFNNGEFNKKNNNVYYQNNTNRSNEDYVASEKTIRDLAERLADRIGLEVEYISDRTQNFKGKLEGNVATINLAYATLDTPIHEILGHPIIRALKNGTIQNKQLYQNLLKELKRGKGKKVFKKIKKNYITKENGEKYTLEEQQEEALVQLLGEYTADRIQKGTNLWKLMKQLLKNMKDHIKAIFKGREVEIDKLPDNMTLGDLADLLAYRNSKIILPGNEVVYITSDNMEFKTYQEASKHISELAKKDEVDLSKISIKTMDIPVDKFTVQRGEEELESETDYIKENNKWFKIDYEYDEDGKHLYKKEITIEEAKKAYFVSFAPGRNVIQSFIERNKEYEQSKEIIEEWKKVNNIKYDPEEVYSRGQGFYSSLGAYSDFDLELLLQNLLNHIEDNKKVGDAFVISAFTKPIGKRLKHLEGEGSRLRYKIFPKSEDIKWATIIDVHSGSVWDASEKVSKDTKSELIGISYTKTPSLNNIHAVQPNLADIIDKRNHHHNELGIELTPYNFRLEYDDDVPYSTKKLVDSINSILDEKYGKLEEPKIYNDPIQPTQTEKILKESIDSIKNKIVFDKDNYFIEPVDDFNPDEMDTVTIGYKINNMGNKLPDKYDKIYDTIKEAQKALEEFKNSIPNKEYTDKALVNTKVATLKKGKQVHPRSLIRSEVRPIGEGFGMDTQYQKVNNKETNIKDQELDEFAKKLSDKFNINFQVLDEEEASKLLSKNKSNIPSGFYDPKSNKIYLVKGRAGKTTPVYEIFTHHFLSQIEKTNPELYNNLLEEAKKNKNIVDYVDKIYKNDENRDYPVSIASTLFELNPNVTDKEIRSIYDNYVNLMNKKREGKAIPFDTFKSLLKVLAVYKYKNTYIFGNYDTNTATFVTRFNSSPTSKELLAEAIPNIVKKGIDFISFVPKDYADKLVRSGYTSSKESYEYNFKGELMQKYAVASNPNVFKKIFNKSADEVTSKELKDYNDSLGLKYNPVEIRPDLVEKAGKDLSNILETYLNQFGIAVKDIKEIKDKLGIDELGFADILSKIAYVKDRKDLPPIAGEFIAFMMQYNPLVKDIIKELSLTDEYKGLKKDEYFKIIGELISKDLQNKLDGNYSKSLINKIKELISKFLNLIKKTPVDLINKNIGTISDNILQQNKKLITSSLYKPGAYGKLTKQVSLEEVMKTDKFGASIIDKISKKGFILTGSTSLGEQGTVQRPNENLLHDIDWISPFSKEETNKRFLEEYPDAIFVREINSNNYTTTSWLIPPDGYSIKNYKIKVIKDKEGNSKTLIDSYDVVDDKGNVKGTYRLVKDDKTGKYIEKVDGVRGKVIDFFTYDTFDQAEPVEKNKIKLANWKETLKAKLEYSRFKDIWDYNRFIPNENRKFLRGGQNSSISQHTLDHEYIARAMDLYAKDELNKKTDKNLVSVIKNSWNNLKEYTRKLLGISENHSKDIKPNTTLEELGKSVLNDKRKMNLKENNNTQKPLESAKEDKVNRSDIISDKEVLNVVGELDKDNNIKLHKDTNANRNMLQQKAIRINNAQHHYIARVGYTEQRIKGYKKLPLILHLYPLTEKESILRKYNLFNIDNNGKRKIISMISTKNNKQILSRYIDNINNNENDWIAVFKDNGNTYSIEIERNVQKIDNFIGAITNNYVNSDDVVVSNQHKNSVEWKNMVSKLGNDTALKIYKLNKQPLTNAELEEYINKLDNYNPNPLYMQRFNPPTDDNDIEWDNASVYEEESENTNTEEIIDDIKDILKNIDISGLNLDLDKDTTKDDKNMINHIFLEFENKLKLRIKLLNDNIASETDDKRIIKLKLQRNELYDIMRNVKDENKNLWQMLDIMENDFNKITNAIKTNTVRIKDVRTYNDTLSLWNMIIKDWQSNTDNVLGEYLRNSLPFQKSLIYYKGVLAGLQNELLIKSKRLVLDSLNKVSNTKMDMSNLDKIKDINTLQKEFLDLSRTGETIVTSVYKLLNNAENKKARNFNAFSKKLEDKLQKLKPKYDFSKKETQHLFLEEDEDGNFTTNLVSDYTYEFYKIQNELRRLQEKLLRSRNIDVIKSLSNDIRKLQKQNVKFIELSTLVSETGLLLVDKVEDLRNTLLKSYDEDYVNKIINEVISKYNNYLEEASLKREQILEKVKTHKDYHKLRVRGKNETKEDVNKRLQMEADSLFNKWEKYNNPIKYLENLSKSNGKLKHSGYKYLTFIPNDEHFSKKMKAIKKDKDLYEFYKFYKESLNKYLNYLPEHKTENLLENFLPYNQKTLLEKIKSRNDIISGIQSSLITNSTVSESVVTKQVNILGEEINKIPVRYLNLSLTDIDIIIDLLQRSNYSNKEEKIKKLKKYKEKRQKNFDTDVVKTLRSFALMAENFNSYNEIEDTVLAAKNAIDNISNVISSRKVKQEGNKNKYTVIQEGAKNIKELLDYTIKAMMYDESREHRPVFERKFYADKEERKLYRKYNKELKILEQKLNQNKITKTKYIIEKRKIEKKISDLGDGRIVTTDTLVDNIIKATGFVNLGYNVKAAINNYLFGKVSLIIHSTGEEDFNREELKQAFKILNRSMMLGFEASNPLNNKIRALSEKFNVAFEVNEAAYGVETLNKKIRKNNPLKSYWMTRKGEYFLQNAGLIAILLHNKIDVKNEKGEIYESNYFDIYDDNGNLRTDLKYRREGTDIFEDTIEDLDENISALESNKLTKITDQVEQLNTMIHGNYDPRHPMKFKSKDYGRVLMQYKTWIPEGWMLKFEKEHFDDMLGRVRKGRYRTISDIGIVNSGFILLKGLLNKNNIKKQDFKKSVDYVNMLKNLNEFRFIVAITIGNLILMSVLMGMRGDDDDENKMKLILSTANQLARLNGDLKFYFSPSSLLQTIKNPAPAVSYIVNLLDWGMKAEKLVPSLQYSDTYTMEDWLKSGMKNFPITNEIAKWKREAKQRNGR